MRSTVEASWLASDPADQKRKRSRAAGSVRTIALVSEESTAVTATPARASFTGVDPERPIRPSR